MNAKPGCSMPWTISSVRALVLKDAPRATKDAPLATANPSVLSGCSRLPYGVDGAFCSEQRGRRHLPLREAVGLVVHHQVQDVDVAPGGVREVPRADREAVAVAADGDDGELRVRELDAHRDRERAPVERVDPVGRDEPGQAARAADPRDDHGPRRVQLELRERAVSDARTPKSPQPGHQIGLRPDL